MARIRSVKPEIRKSLTVGAWPREVRLAWVYLWGYLDDYGRGQDNARVIAADCFPLDDDVTHELMGHWLDLFEATAAELFVPDLAEQFACKARRIAESLKLALFFRPDRSWPEDLRHRPPVSDRCA